MVSGTGESFVDPCLQGMHCCLCNDLCSDVAHLLRCWQGGSYQLANCYPFDGKPACRLGMQLSKRHSLIENASYDGLPAPSMTSSSQSGSNWWYFACSLYAAIIPISMNCW